MREMTSTKNVQYIYDKLTFFFTLKFIVSVHKFIFVDCFLQDSAIYDVQTVLFYMLSKLWILCCSLALYLKAPSGKS